MDMFSILIGKYWELELLGHSNSIFDLLRMVRLFPKAAGPFYYYQQRMKAPILYILANICYCPFF